MRHLIVFFYLFIFSLSINSYSQCEFGDPCKTLDTNCLDSNYPVINEFAKAGVTGGIPKTLPIALTINNTNNLQNSINQVHTNGGGVILLSPGTYSITSPIYLKSNVVLRGENVNTVILESTIRAIQSNKKNTIEFDQTTNAGIENITFFYKVNGFEPIDRESWLNGGWCGECFQNNPHNLNNLYVRTIAIQRNSNNCWVQGCKILNSGSDPIFLAGNHNTFRNNYVDRSYNKGGSGNGYYDVRGTYNLIVNDTVKRIRHFAVQQKAAYNVIMNCYIEGDVNFHNKDDGNNLVERNTIILPKWHGWNIFGTGGEKFGHVAPGPNNILVNNTTNHKDQGPRFADPNTIYTFIGYGVPDATNWKMPTCGTFYPMVDTSLSLNNTPSNPIKINFSFSKNKLILEALDIFKEVVKVYDTLGQEIALTQTLKSKNRIEIDFTNTANGIYFIKTQNSSHKIYKQ